MQISQLRKLLHPIKRLTSRRAEKPSAETLESRAESEMEMQSDECRVQSDECRVQNAECIMQNSELASPFRRGGGEADGEVNSPDAFVNSLDEAASETTCEENAPVAEESKPCEEPSNTPSHTVNTKAHLTSSVPRAARLPQGALTKGQMAEIREIFGDIDDAEIQRLYKRVTK